MTDASFAITRMPVDPRTQPCFCAPSANTGPGLPNFRTRPSHLIYSSSSLALYLLLLCLICVLSVSAQLPPAVPPLDASQAIDMMMVQMHAKQYPSYQAQELDAEAVKHLRGVPFTPNRFHSRKLTRFDWCRDCIDVIIPYVNGSDPWYEQNLSIFMQERNWKFDAVSPNRFRDHNELLYNLRGIESFAPWVRYVHIVVNGAQIPDWIWTRHPRVRIVPHSVIFPEPDLPTFSIYAIKMHLHRIPDLAPRFVYFEDDQFFGVPSTPEWFFLNNGTTLHFIEYGTTINPHPPAIGDPDNTEWLALRNTARVLLKKYPTLQSIDYPTHMPFGALRELQREAVEEEFLSDCAASSYARFRGPRGVDTRLLLPYYQMNRKPRQFDISHLFQHSFDINRDGVLSGDEILAIAQYCDVKPEAFVETLAPGVANVPGKLAISLGQLQRDDNAVRYLRSGFQYWEGSAGLYAPGHLKHHFVMMLPSPIYLEYLFSQVMSTTPHIFCLNDNLDSLDENVMNASETTLQKFLSRYFPAPSSFELSTHQIPGQDAFDLIWDPKSYGKLPLADFIQKAIASASESAEASVSGETLATNALANSINPPAGNLDPVTATLMESVPLTPGAAAPLPPIPIPTMAPPPPPPSHLTSESRAAPLPPVFIPPPTVPVVPLTPPPAPTPPPPPAVVAPPLPPAVVAPPPPPVVLLSAAPVLAALPPIKQPEPVRAPASETPGSAAPPATLPPPVPVSSPAPPTRAEDEEGGPVDLPFVVDERLRSIVKSPKAKFVTHHLSRDLQHSNPDMKDEMHRATAAPSPSWKIKWVTEVIFRNRFHDKNGGHAEPIVM